MILIPSGDCQLEGTLPSPVHQMQLETVAEDRPVLDHNVQPL